MVLEVDAAARELVVWQREAVIKRLALKGGSQRLLAFEAFVDQLAAEAHTEWRRTQASFRARRLQSWAGG